LSIHALDSPICRFTHSFAHGHIHSSPSPSHPVDRPTCTQGKNGSSTGAGVPHGHIHPPSGLALLLGSNPGLMRLWQWQSDALNRSHPMTSICHRGARGGGNQLHVGEDVRRVPETLTAAPTCPPSLPIGCGCCTTKTSTNQNSPYICRKCTRPIRMLLALTTIYSTPQQRYHFIISFRCVQSLMTRMATCLTN
jgi:hypothetical protein